MGKFAAYVLLLGGLVTYLIGASSRLPLFLTVAELAVATVMFSLGVYLLVNEELLLR